MNRRVRDMADRLRLLGLRLLVLAAVLGLWVLLVRTGAIDPFFFPRPLDIVTRIFKWFISGEIYQHLWVTLIEVLLAYVIGTILGVVSGLWLGLSLTAVRILEPYIMAFNSFPRVILAYIVLFWSGLGLLSV